MITLQVVQVPGLGPREQEAALLIPQHLAVWAPGQILPPLPELEVAEAEAVRFPRWAERAGYPEEQGEEAIVRWALPAEWALPERAAVAVGEAAWR